MASRQTAVFSKRAAESVLGGAAIFKFRAGLSCSSSSLNQSTFKSQLPQLFAIDQALEKLQATGSGD
jgi:hypothetical protein